MNGAPVEETMRYLVVALALVGVACGTSARDETPAVSPAAATTGALHDVQMLVTPEGQYIYQPAALDIKVGDRVRWVNVSGGPHNVAFYENGIPAGARDLLNAAMADRMGDLTGALLFEPNAVYEISFVGAPAGTYEYFCTPHEMLGMKAQITVSR
jgi:plastocyanin